MPLGALQIDWLIDSRDLGIMRVEVTDAIPESPPKVDGRSNKSGGKRPARRLIRQLNLKSKRGNFLQWFLESEDGGTIGSCMSEFGMTRQNVIAYWTNIVRDHGIGYTLTNNTIRPVLPKGATPQNIFEKDHGL
jgi:hypothetical protein